MPDINSQSENKKIAVKNALKSLPLFPSNNCYRFNLRSASRSGLTISTYLRLTIESSLSRTGWRNLQRPDMIEFHDVSKSFTEGSARKAVLENASFRILAGQKLGILAPEGADKRTLATLFCGTEAADSGRIARRGRVSFPFGSIPGLDPKLSALENTRHLARLYRLDADHAEACCRYLTGAGLEFDLPLDTAPAILRKRLAFSLMLTLPFDVYVLEEDLPRSGDVAFMQRAMPILHHRLSHGTLVLVSSKPSPLHRYCKTFAVLTAGRLVTCKTLDQARGTVANAA
jgi:capsular polysaccharide transport system ATP-binding protein